jgi:dipeptidyl aminopeptidase/acylaminoacyl peptidase
VAQGANDPRVKQSESDQIVDAVRRKGLDAEYVVYADEGHGLARPQNRLHYYALVERFLARHLGGRTEPMREVPGHSGEMR